MTQMSCNFKEQRKIVRAGGVPLWRRGASRCLPKPPPTPPCLVSVEFTRGENEILRRGCGIQTLDWNTERSETECLKGGPKWAAGLSRLHSILQAISLWRTVYTRTKLATTAHVEQWVLCSFSRLTTAAHSIHFQPLMWTRGYGFKTPTVKRSLG